ncbi:MAG TPA: GNAT family N-acetyltransferase [Anaerolineae bacterium]|jgi:acetyltransferase|nr:GNAT family N-acetyltransferase [Anaerolineae bacterium]
MDNEGLHTFQAKDGLVLWFRPLTVEDAHHLVDLFEHMGPESRFLRFNLALPNPDPELIWSEARRLSRLDPERDGAWLVFADLPDQDDAPVGGVRYVRLDDETAEASLAVRDDMQRKGIGGEMLRFLVEQARAAGVQRLVATVQRGNRPLWHLLQSSGLEIEMASEGSYTNIAVELTQPEGL